eukprot:4653321-Pyramimonas_sp.AAC.1
MVFWRELGLPRRNSHVCCRGVGIPRLVIKCNSGLSRNTRHVGWRRWNLRHDYLIRFRFLRTQHLR